MTTNNPTRCTKDKRTKSGVVLAQKSELGRLAIGTISATAAFLVT